MVNIREQFPILGSVVYDKPLVYLDSAATTQKPSVVVDVIKHVYEHANANIHRGVHYLSNVATRAHEEARERVGRFINASSSREVIFTRGTTEAINLVAFCFTERYCVEGDEIVVTEMEHHSNIVPWQLACDRRGLKLRVAPINDRGELVVKDLYGLITERTKLIAVAHVSNVLGSINPIKEIVERAHACGVRVLVDGAQAIAHLSVDVQDLDADFYVFSGHKVYAPNGIGVLYGRECLLEEMPPYQGGGEMIDTVTFERTVFNKLPYKYEAGTPDYVGSVALARALDFLEGVGIEDVVCHERELMEYAMARMEAVPGMRIFGGAANRCGVISFLVGGIHPSDLGVLLDRQGVAIRTGHHCAQPLLERLGVAGTARISFGVYTTKADIDAFIKALKVAIDILQ